jgi:glutamyl-tRNA synthetase
VGDYQDKGIFPAAMRNFLALLGWSPGGDREIMSEAELIEAFSLEGIQKKPAVFDTAKLEWMNGQYLSQRSADELLAPTERELERMGVDTGGRDLRPLIDAVKARSRTILNIAEQVAVRIDASRVVRDEKGEKLAAKLGPAFNANLALVAGALEAIPAAEWSSERILADVKALAEAKGAKLGDLMQPVRVVLTGSTVSEPVNDLLVVIGREESLRRIRG